MPQQRRLTRKEQEEIRSALRAGRKPKTKSVPKDPGKPGKRMARGEGMIKADKPSRAQATSLLGSGLAAKAAKRIRRRRDIAKDI